MSANAMKILNNFYNKACHMERIIKGSNTRENFVGLIEKELIENEKLTEEEKKNLSTQVTEVANKYYKYRDAKVKGDSMPVKGLNSTIKKLWSRAKAFVLKVKIKKEMDKIQNINQAAVKAKGTGRAR